MSKKNRKQKQMEREIRRNKQFQYNQEKKGENIQRVKQNSLPSSSQDNSLFRSNKEIDDYLDKIKRVKQNSTLVHSKNMEKWIENEYEKGETAWCPWDDAPTLLTPPSKEKLETFLKEVGGRSPFYYKNSSDRELMKQKKTIGFLWYMWREVMGLNDRGNDETLKTIEPFYWFVELEHLITNKEMFWTLMTSVWVNKSEVFTDNPAIFERYGRDKVSLEKKMECADHLTRISAPTISTTNIKEENQSSKDFLLSMLDSVEDDEMIIYRSFKVEKGKSIRKGVSKIDNPYSRIQEEGRGWSYSINKTNSIIINGMTTTFYYKKYLNMNDDNARTHLQKHRKLSKHKMNDITLNCNFYNCIGTYIVKKKDIMFMTDDWGECEIIVNPKNAKLIDYGFLNIYDYFTQTFVRTLINAKWLGGGKRLGMSGVLNIDKFYKFMRKIVKKLVIDEPKYIIDFLQSNKYADSKGWMDKCIELMEEGGKKLGVLVATYKENTNAECIKYYLCLNDGKGGVDYFENVKKLNE